MKTHLTTCEQFFNEYGQHYVDASSETTTSTIRPSLSNEEAEELRILLAKAVYFAALPFSIYENPFLIHVFERLSPGFAPPERHAIADRYLSLVYDEVVRESMLKIEDLKYVGCAADDWSNGRNEGMTNVVLTTPEPLLTAVSAHGEKQATAENLAEKLSNVFVAIGAEKVAGIVHDNAANMFAMDERLRANFPHLICAGCASHSGNLLFGDVFEIEMFKDQWEHVDDICLRCSAKRSTISLLFITYQVLFSGNIPVNMENHFCAHIRTQDGRSNGSL